MDKRALLFVAVAVMGFLALWTWRSRSAGDRPRALTAKPPAAPAEQGFARKIESGVTSRVSAAPVERANEAAAPPPEGERPAAEGPELAGADRPNLIVTVVKEGTAEPVSGASVNAWVDFRDRDPSDEDEPMLLGFDEVPRTDEHGVAEILVDTGVRIELHVTSVPSWRNTEEPEIGNRTLQLNPILPGEERQLTVEVPHGRDLVFWGRILSEPGGTPIPEAFACQLGDADFSPLTSLDPSELYELSDGRPPSNAVQARSDAAGLFQLSVRSWDPGAFVLAAPGHGPRYFAPGPGHSLPEDAQELPLLPSASLRARVVDHTPDARGRLTVTLRSKGYEMNFPDDSGDFLGNGFFDLDPSWTATCDPTGLSTFTGLPARVPFVIEIARGSRVARQIEESFTLNPGEAREVEWRIGAGARLFGTVVDQNGRPVGNTELWLKNDEDVFSPDGTSCLLQDYWRDEISHRAATDDSGAFEILDVPAGRWWLGPAPDNPFVRPADPNGLSPTAVAIEVPVGRGEQEVALEVDRGLFLKGRVVIPSGERGVEAFVTGTSLKTGLWFNGQAGADGYFRLGPLSSGAYRLGARCLDLDTYAKSAFVSANAGDDDIEIRLRQGGRLEGRVIDIATGAGSAARMVYVGPDDPTSVTMTATEEDGRFERGGVLPGTYHLVAVAEGQRIGMLRNIEVAAASEVRSLTIELRPGARLRIRYEGDPEYCHFTVLHTGIPIAVDGLRRGTSTEHTVPASRIVVEILVPETMSRETRELELGVGGVEEVVFEPGG